MIIMAVYNCEYDLKSNIYENCKDNSIEIVGASRLYSYDDVRHLVAFVIDKNIYNICNSGDHGNALNALIEKYGKDNAVIITLEKNKYWGIYHKTESIDTLKTLKEFLISIYHRIDHESSITVDGINPNIKDGIYKTKDMEYLIEQFSNTIEYYEEQMKQEKEEKIIKEIVEQIENRNNKTIAEKVRRYLCGR